MTSYILALIGVDANGELWHLWLRKVQDGPLRRDAALLPGSSSWLHQRTYEQVCVGWQSLFAPSFVHKGKRVDLTVTLSASVCAGICMYSVRAQQWAPATCEAAPYTLLEGDVVALLMNGDRGGYVFVPATDAEAAHLWRRVSRSKPGSKGSR